MAGFPYHMLRRFLKAQIEYEISKEYILYVKEFLDEMLNQIAIGTLKELDEINRLRGIQKLHKLKRIDESIFINLLDKTFKPKMNFNHGETGRTNKDTVLSEAIEVA